MELPSLTFLWSLIWPKLGWLLIAIVIDFIFGVINALLKKKFDLAYLSHFVNSSLLPALAWVAWVILAQIPAGDEPILPVTAEVVYYIVMAGIVGSFLKTLVDMGVLTEILSKVTGGLKKPT